MKEKGGKRKTSRRILGPNLLHIFKKINREKNGLDSNEDGSGNEEEGDSNQQVVFKYKWLKTWEWMRYDKDENVVFCTTCESFAITGNSPYAKGGCKNLKTSSFNEHAACKTHLTAEARKLDHAKPRKPVVVAVQKMHESVDGAILNLFRVAYTVAARTWSFNDFEHVVNLLQITGCSSITKQLYHNDHACQEFICCISASLHSSLVAKVKASTFFGLQVDESTDIASQQHIVLCISYLENGGEPKRNFLGILRVKDAGAASLFESLLNYLQHVAGFDMSKLVAFGSDGASTMTGKNTGVAARLKQRYPFLTSIHCIAHRANLAVVDASKKDSMEWLEEIENLVNAIAGHFSCSSKRLEKLQVLLEEYACDILRLDRIQQTRWLSRHNAISKLCDDLPAVLKYTEIESCGIWKQVANFSTIYLLHFLADILGGLTILSKLFQADYVDITCVPEHVKSTICGIQLYYVTEPAADLNAFQQDRRGYPIIPDFGPPEGFLVALRSSLHGNEYRGCKISRDIDGADLCLHDKKSLLKQFVTVCRPDLKIHLFCNILVLFRH